MTTSAPDALVGAGTTPIPPALQGFIGLADCWGLSTEDQLTLLGSPGRSTYFKWKKDGGTLPKDTAERISHLLAIFKALAILLPDARAADSWVNKRNDYFGGQSALQVMLDSFAGIYRVRQYIDAQRGG